jgi:hypothetical protein
VICHEKVEKEEEQKLFKAKAVNILGFDTSFDDTEIHVKQEAAQMLREVMRMTYPERAHDQVFGRRGIKLRTRKESRGRASSFEAT